MLFPSGTGEFITSGVGGGAGCHQSRFAKYYSPQAVRLILELLGEP